MNTSYLIEGELCFICICDRSYPRKLAFTYLSDLSREFTTTYQPQQYLSPTCRPYAFVEFDTFIQRTKKTYQDSRATQNLDKLNDELKDVTKVMTKNIEDLLYRGDSLERMGDISSRLREDSRKYKKAAVRINWELLLKQVSAGHTVFRVPQDYGLLMKNSTDPSVAWPSS
jgi:vesicle transport protein SEC22